MSWDHTHDLGCYKARARLPVTGLVLKMVFVIKQLSFQHKDYFYTALVPISRSSQPCEVSCHSYFFSSKREGRETISFAGSYASLPKLRTHLGCYSWKALFVITTTSTHVEKLPYKSAACSHKQKKRKWILRCCSWEKK